MKTPMFLRMLVCMTGLCLALCGTATAGELVPAKGGDLCAIVVGASPDAVQKGCAQDLQRIFKAITGKEIAISAEAVEGRCLFIGCAPESENLSGKLSQLGPEGIYLSVSRKRIICAGSDPRGTYYAVQELLYQMGCRWIWPGKYGECLPASGPLALPSRLELLHTPDFAMRGGHLVQVEARPGEKQQHINVAEYVDWAARNKWNRIKASYPWTWEYGDSRGGEWQETAGHTTTVELLPASVFEEHPEFFALVKGKRVAVHPAGTTAMPCIGSPAVIDRFTDIIMAYFAANPRASRYFIGANDEPSYWCECDACKKLDALPVDWSKNGEGMLPMTDRWMYLVNTVAERVEKKYPGKWIGTYAYGSTNNPPVKTMPRKNVMVEYCVWNHCPRHAFLDANCRVNSQAVQEIKAWKAVATAIDIYSYGDYSLYEVPGPYSLSDQEYYRSLHKLGIRHISDDLGTTTMASPVMLGYRARLLWDLKTDPRQYLRELCRAAYGSAAFEMEQFWALQQEAVYKSPTKHPKLGSDLKAWVDESGRTWQNDLGRYSPAIVARSYGLLDAASRKQLTDDQRARIERARLSMMFVDFYLAKDASRSGDVKDLANMANARARIYKQCRKYGFAINEYALIPLGPVDADTASTVVNGKPILKLPDQWMFRLDQKETGEGEKWFLPGTDMSAYKPISISDIWENQGYAAYDGTAWYVLDVTIPPTDSKRVWLLFGAVDDSWKAWLDGQPIGASVGTPSDTWDKPAAVDITGKYRPGVPARLAVKVNDMAGGGGIWRGATIMGSD